MQLGWDPNRVLQVALQYGASAAGGGAFWSVATWVLIGDTYFFTPATAASVGQELTASIYPTLLGNPNEYTAEFQNIPISTLQYWSDVELGQWMRVRLTSFGIVNERTDYPNGMALFRSIDITWDWPDIRYAPVTWTGQDSVPGDNLFLSVIVDGAARSGQLAFRFPDFP